MAPASARQNNKSISYISVMKLARVLVCGFLMLWVFSRGGGGEGVMTVCPCNFPAIYNFGDSNSDTGGLSAAFKQLLLPNGETFFRRPSGRFCNGRLIIDLMANNLRLPFLHPYLDSIQGNFRHGSNFATGGSTIRQPNETIFQSGTSPFSLDVQLLQFEQFKARTSYLYNQTAENGSDISRLPRPEDFSKALYTIDIGQNDLSQGFLQRISIDKIRASIPDIIDNLTLVVEKLYKQGARTFWIHNTGPLGCLPRYIPLIRAHYSTRVDKYGCLESPNDIAKEFNQQLYKRVFKLRKQLPYAALTYVAIHGAKYELIRNAKKLGFGDPLNVCYDAFGQKMNMSDTEAYRGSCDNPSTYISWDGIHYTEAANQLVAKRIINGSLSYPRLPLAYACYIEHKHLTTTGLDQSKNVY